MPRSIRHLYSPERRAHRSGQSSRVCTSLSQYVASVLAAEVLLVSTCKYQSSGHARQTLALASFDINPFQHPVPASTQHLPLEQLTARGFVGQDALDSHDRALSNSVALPHDVAVWAHACVFDIHPAFKRVSWDGSGFIMCLASCAATTNVPMYVRAHRLLQVCLLLLVTAAAAAAAAARGAPAGRR